MVGWSRPRGVAPKRMPKADATGLAPKNRHNPSEAVRPGGVFVGRYSLVKSPSGGLGL